MKGSGNYRRVLADRKSGFSQMTISQLWDNFSHYKRKRRRRSSPLAEQLSSGGDGSIGVRCQQSLRSAGLRRCLLAGPLPRLPPCAIRNHSLCCTRWKLNSAKNLYQINCKTYSYANEFQSISKLYSIKLLLSIFHTCHLLSPYVYSILHSKRLIIKRNRV